MYYTSEHNVAIWKATHLKLIFVPSFYCWQKKHGFYIVEEDDYHECWFETKPFKPLVRQNHEGHVIYCGAFSLISSYLQQTRTIVAAEEFIELIKLNPLPENLFRDLVMEATVTELLNSNKLWPLSTEEELLDNSDAKRMLKICDKTLYRWRKNKLITPRIIGNKYYYVKADLIRLMENL